MSAVYRPLSILKKIARAFGGRMTITYHFQAMSFYIYEFSRNDWYFGEVIICN